LGQTTKFKVKSIQITSKFLGVGIGTKNMFGSADGSNKDSLSILYYYDAVYEYGVYRNLGRTILTSGDIVEMIVNRSANVVTWLTNGNKIG